MSEPHPPSPWPSSPDSTPPSATGPAPGWGGFAPGPPHPPSGGGFGPGQAGPGGFPPGGYGPGSPGTYPPGQFGGGLPPVPPPPRSRKNLMIGLTMAGLMLVMVVAFVIFGLNTTDPEPERDAAGYPPQAKIDFMAGCEGAEEETELFGESATDVCECLFTEIQKDLTYQEFLQYSVEAFDNDLGEFEDDLIEWTSTCLEGVDFGS